MTTFDHETYLSPLTWRYGSDAMRQLWSEAEKRRLLRRFWVALAEAQAEVGLVTAEQAADLRRQQANIDITRAEAIEREIQSPERRRRACNRNEPKGSLPQLLSEDHCFNQKEASVSPCLCGRLRRLCPYRSCGH